ncbi:transcriptional regulator [Candidatus Woesearchaeota archaeon]|nr:MAG: transcriptional regulator [Candidatus Woesearchaeota archaeon]
MLSLQEKTKETAKPRIAVIPLDKLKPHERVDERHLEYLAGIIIRDGIIIKPLLVDAKTMIILDGHHRYEVLKGLGKKYASVLLVYYDSDHVKVGSWRGDWNVSKDLVREAGLTGKLLPPKTSRHMLKFKIPDVNIPLDKL